MGKTCAVKHCFSGRCVDRNRRSKMKMRQASLFQVPRMPRRCSVPGCKSNYDSVLKENPECITTFSFPKKEDLKSQWLRAIPRKNWTPTLNACVCSRHFNESDIIRYDKWLQPDGSYKQIKLKCPKLKECVIPSVFLNLPSDLSSEPQPKRVDPDARRDKILKCPIQRQKWIKSLSQDLESSQFVCELHFSDADIKKENIFDVRGQVTNICNDRWHLKKGAVPIIQYKHRQNEEKLQQQRQFQNEEQLQQESTDSDDDEDDSEVPQSLSNSEKTVVQAKSLTLDDVKSHFNSLPETWCYTSSPSEIIFIYLDRFSFKEKLRLRVTADLSVMISFSKRKEIRLSEHITSIAQLNSYISAAENCVLCTGTGMEGLRYAPECIGMIDEDEKYQRQIRFLRCKACRTLRKRLQTKKSLPPSLSGDKKNVQVILVKSSKVKKRDIS